MFNSNSCNVISTSKKSVRDALLMGPKPKKITPDLFADMNSNWHTPYKSTLKWGDSTKAKLIFQFKILAFIVPSIIISIKKFKTFDRV
jgi:hypothetical protein